MASGWNLWVWLVGVVVRRYIDILIIIITFPYSTCISSFLAAASLLLCSFKKMFFRSFKYVFIKASKVLNMYRMDMHASIHRSKTWFCKKGQLYTRYSLIYNLNYYF